MEHECTGGDKKELQPSGKRKCLWIQPEDLSANPCSATYQLGDLDRTQKGKDEVIPFTGFVWGLTKTVLSNTISGEC